MDFTGNTGSYDVVMGIYYNLGKYVENGDILPLEPFLEDPALRDRSVRMDNFFELLWISAPAITGNSTASQRPQTQCISAYARTSSATKKSRLRSRRATATISRSHPPIRRSLGVNTEILLNSSPEGRERGWRERISESDFYGTCLQAKRHPALWYEFVTISPLGAVAWSTRPVRWPSTHLMLEALKFYIGLRSFSPPGTLQYNWDDALTAFQQGHIALATMWFDSTPPLYDPTASKVVGKVGYGQIPVVDKQGPVVAQYGGWGFYINADTKHPKEAFRLIQWLNRPEVQVAWAKEGGLPSTLTTFENPEYLKVPYRRAQRVALEHAVAWTRAPYSEEINSKAVDRIAQAVSGQSTPEEALSGLAKDVRALLEARKR